MARLRGVCRVWRRGLARQHRNFAVETLLLPLWLAKVTAIAAIFIINFSLSSSSYSECVAEHPNQKLISETNSRQSAKNECSLLRGQGGASHLVFKIPLIGAFNTVCDAISGAHPTYAAFHQVVWYQIQFCQCIRSFCKVAS